MSAAPNPSAAERPLPAPTPNFDRVARIYSWAEYLALGSLLRRTREQFLPELLGARTALVLGDGDGRFAAALLRLAPELHIQAVDLSAAMLRLLAARCARDGNQARLTVKRASALTADPPSGCDLVATHFLLDCLAQRDVEALARRMARHLQPGGLWVLSEFGLPHRRLLRPFARLYIRTLYLAFRVLTGLRVQRLPDHQEALAAAGFSRVRRVDRLGGLLYAELWQRDQVHPELREHAVSRATSAAPETSTPL